MRRRGLIISVGFNVEARTSIFVAWHDRVTVKRLLDELPKPEVCGIRMESLMPVLPQCKRRQRNGRGDDPNGAELGEDIPEFQWHIGDQVRLCVDQVWHGQKMRRC